MVSEDATLAPITSDVYDHHGPSGIYLVANYFIFGLLFCIDIIRKAKSCINAIHRMKGTPYTTPICST